MWEVEEPARGEPRCAVPLLAVASVFVSLFTPNMDRSEKESRSDEEADYEDEEVDPRIQVFIYLFFIFLL